MLKKEHPVPDTDTNQIHHENQEVTEEEEDQESDYEDDDSSEKGNSKSKNNIQKPKQGGVNQGQTKKASNASATAVSAALKSKVNVKSGPV